MQKAKFEFNEQQVNYLLHVLSERPYKESAQAINQIQQTWQAQNPVAVVEPQKQEEKND